MTLDEAILVVERIAGRKEALGRAERTSPSGREIGEQHLHGAEAMQIVLAAVRRNEPKPPSPGIAPYDTQTPAGKRLWRS